MSKEIRPMNELCSQRRSNACSHRRERLKLPFFENRPPLLGWATVSEPAPGPAVARPAKKERAGARVRTRKRESRRTRALNWRLSAAIRDFVSTLFFVARVSSCASLEKILERK